MVVQAQYIALPSNQPFNAAGPQLGVGGEGEVKQVSDKLAVKILHKANIEKELKVGHLIDYQKYYQSKASRGGLFALPLQKVQEVSTGNPGYLMPLVQGSVGLDEIISGHSRFRNYNLKHLAGLLANLCCLVKTGHDMGFVFGDMTPPNFRVYLKDFKVIAIDMDSPQIDLQGKYFPCEVGTMRYMAPEIMKSGDLKARREVYSDYHALAGIIFEVVTGGIHYCQGPIELSQSSDELPPDVNKRITNGWWPYSSSYGLSTGRACPGRITPPPKSVDYSVFGTELQRLFTLAFDLGFDVPKRRPAPQQWMKALHRYASRLVICPKNPRPTTSRL